MPPPNIAQGRYDLESISYGSFDDKDVRRRFISRVYTIVMTQLFVTIGFVAVFTFSEEAQSFALEHPLYALIFMGLNLFIIIALTCCESVRRTSPTNWIMLGIFTVSMSFMVGFMVVHHHPEDVLLALGITAVLVFMLTMFAMQTAIDFTAFTGIIFVALILMMIFGIVTIFIHSKMLRLIYCCLGAGLFCVILIIDTQMIVNGVHKSEITSEEYVFAALSLYTDMIYLFLYILEILGLIDD